MPRVCSCGESFNGKDVGPRFPADHIFSWRKGTMLMRGGNRKPGPFSCKRPHTHPNRTRPLASFVSIREQQKNKKPKNRYYSSTAVQQCTKRALCNQLLGPPRVIPPRAGQLLSSGKKSSGPGKRTQTKTSPCIAIYSCVSLKVRGWHNQPCSGWRPPAVGSREERAHNSR